MSQLVVRNMSLGFSEVQAVSIMTLLACIGVAGSFLIGVMDDKIGTKKNNDSFWNVVYSCTFS